MLKRIVKVMSIFALLLLVIFVPVTANKSIPEEEREITFKAYDGFTLYGTLSIPERDENEKLPAILLVHGSGPQDRDETINSGGMSLKPLKELADHLLRKGYVVLRYDKRSYTMVKNGFTEEEFEKVLPDVFIQDAKAAIDFLTDLPEVDPEKIFLIGHSQGGSFAPYIVEDKKLAGTVLLAPGLLPVSKQIEYQLQYQIKYLENINQLGQFTKNIEQLKDLLNQYETAFKAIEEGSLDDNANIMGATVAFFKRWEELTTDLTNKIKEIKTPVLIINGTTDMLCPVELLKEREADLKEKRDLKIVYIENMIHQLYYMGMPIFAKKVPDEIHNWIQVLLE